MLLFVPVIFSADCNKNVFPSTSIHKQAGLTPEERISFRSVLEEAKLVDTFRHFHPTAEGAFSYYCQRQVENRELNRGFRLDYVLASKSMCVSRGQLLGTGDNAVIADSFVIAYSDHDETVVSDHLAVGCDIIVPRG
jgi:exonuclease III